MKHAIKLVQDGEQLQIEAIVAFLINYGAHWNTLFIIKVKILVLIK